MKRLSTNTHSRFNLSGVVHYFGDRLANFVNSIALFVDGGMAQV